LSEFVGRRWWRAGVESLVFDLASKDPSSIGVLHEQLSAVEPGLQFIAGTMAYPIIDGKFATKDYLGVAEDVIEVVPDDWPPFADSAWALLSDIAANPDLGAIARDGDLDKG